MQQDEVIWQVINHTFCSFKSKVAKERTFCNNPYNVTGLCIRSACPLANSRYATIREHDGKVFLYMKTIERAHTPKDLWEKIQLPANYTKALELVTEHLQYFPKYLQHRNKQRLTKIHQYLIRMRKLKLRPGPKITSVSTKVEKLERRREAKALRAARLEETIEKELLQRLQQASDGEIFNFPEVQYKAALSKASSAFDKNEGEEEEESHLQEEEEEEEEEQADGISRVEYVEDFEASDDDDIEESYKQQLEAAVTRVTGGKRPQSAPEKGILKKPRRGAHVEVEYEYDDDQPRQTLTQSSDIQFNF